MSEENKNISEEEPISHIRNEEDGLLEATNSRGEEFPKTEEKKQTSFADYSTNKQRWQDLMNSPEMREMQTQAVKLRELTEKITGSPAMEAARKFSEQSAVFARQLQEEMKPFRELSKQWNQIHIPPIELPDFKALSQLGTGWSTIKKQQELLKSLGGGIAACEAAKIALSPRELSPVISELSKIKHQITGTTYDAVRPAIRKAIVSDINDLETITAGDNVLFEKLPESATKLSLTLFAELPNAVNSIITSLSDIFNANQTIAEENKVAIIKLTAVMESNAKISEQMLVAGKMNTDAIVELKSISKTTLEAAQAQLEIIKNNYVETSKQWKRSDIKTNCALGLAIASIILTLIVSGFSCWLAHRDSESTTAAIKISQETNSYENQEIKKAILHLQPAQQTIGDKQK